MLHVRQLTHEVHAETADREIRERPRLIRCRQCQGVEGYPLILDCDLQGGPATGNTGLDLQRQGPGCTGGVGIGDDIDAGLFRDEVQVMPALGIKLVARAITVEQRQQGGQVRPLCGATGTLRMAAKGVSSPMK